MTAQVKFDNGEVVEDTINDVNGHVLSDIYSVLRDDGNTSYAVADALEGEASADDGDPEAQRQWGSILKNVHINGTHLGGVQAAATDYSLREYKKYGEPYKRLPTEGLTADELDEAVSGNVISYIDSEKTEWSAAADVKLPISSDGERLPLFVTDDGRDGTHTVEEATAILESVLNRIPGVNDVDLDAESNTTTDSNDARSGEFSRFNFIEGVGPATNENIEDAAFSMVATRAPTEAEWPDSFTDDPFYVEDEWNDVPENKADYVTNDESEESIYADADFSDVAQRLNEMDDLSEQMQGMAENVMNNHGPASALEFLDGC